MTNGLFLSITSDDYNSGSLTIPVGVTSQSFSFANVAKNAEARVVVKDVNDVVRFDSETEIAVCGDIAVALEESEVTLVSSAFTITGQCSNDTTKTTPLSGALVTYQLEGKGAVKAMDNGDGSYALADLADGSTYIVKSTLTGDKFKDITVANTEVSAGADGAVTVSYTCDTSTGATGGS